MGLKLIPDLAPIDKKAIEELGIPSLLLMEEAGRLVALRIHKLIQQMGEVRPTVTIVCGKGNNGGDGFVCARRLAMFDSCWVNVVHVAPIEEMSIDAQTNFKLLGYYPVNIVATHSLEQVDELLSQSQFIVDALFGSGLKRPIEGLYQDLIQAINTSGAVNIAIDLPSGVQSATGNVLGSAIRADYTLTFGAPKPGLFLYPGKEHAGQVEVVNIGIPRQLIESDPSKLYLISPEKVASLMPNRPGSSHKYQFGNVLIIAGSKDMPGAAAMTAEACLRAGAGMVTLACPSSSFDRMQLSEEVICLSLPESAYGVVIPEAFDVLKEYFHKFDTIAVGPGMKAVPESTQFFEKLLDYLIHTHKGGVVIDADGLNCLAQMQNPPKLGERFILTPHLGECSRLLKQDKHTIQQDLMLACQKTAEKYHATIILKSSSTVIHRLGDRTWVNPTGNAGMATAGSGDILTGFVSGFLAQGLRPDRAARVSVYLHGMAGDKAAEELTQFCMTATDLIRFLPLAIKQVTGLNKP